MQSPLTLLQTLIHSLFGSPRDHRNSTSSQCADYQNPRVITSSHKTSDMHDLSMIFDQQDLFNEFGTIGRGDCYNCLDVISFSRTFKDFTSKLFDGFLLMKYEEFYQDIYNNNISQDNHPEVFHSSHEFSSETRFRTPAIKRQRQAILDLYENTSSWTG